MLPPHGQACRTRAFSLPRLIYLLRPCTGLNCRETGGTDPGLRDWRAETSPVWTATITLLRGKEITTHGARLLPSWKRRVDNLTISTFIPPGQRRIRKTKRYSVTQRLSGNQDQARRCYSVCFYASRRNISLHAFSLTKTGEQRLS